MQITAPATSNTGKTAKSGKNAKNEPLQETAVDPDLLDTFTQQTREAQEEQLRLEHEAQMQTRQKLHSERIAALWAQLHTQLFTIWNEVWLQRQKVHDDAFKAWLKLLIG